MGLATLRQESDSDKECLEQKAWLNCLSVCIDYLVDR